METYRVKEEYTVHNIVQGKYNPQKWASFLMKAQQNDSCSDYDSNREKFLEHMRMYEERNHTALKLYYDYYKKAISPDFFEKHYVLLREDRLRGLLAQCKVMILTANPIEKAIFHYMMIERSHRKIIRILNNNTVYFILKWGKYWVAHIHQNETGAYKNMGSNATINEALKHLIPKLM